MTDGHSGEADGALRGRPGAPEISTPEWLASLARAGTRMAVPAAMRPPETGGRRSAVLILFGEGEHGPDVLLIQRNDNLRRHAGQPAFPGGSFEPHDESAEACAVREAVEETGVDPAGIELLGRLPELYIRHSGFRVVPVLAWWREPSAVHPADTHEVAEVVRVPVAELADPANRVRVRHPNGGTGPAFRVRGLLVWGFTAAILNRLLVLGGWERPWLDGAAVEPLPLPGAGAAERSRARAPRGPGS
ncbi:8-oxo-dGTP pyrophosphatase MutT (NUDIX family) [Streptomonospora nanhaiensis]|uniref:8-oxo-dGTP pyrophosphatase MutT (NUDIX family) n=2 Tax=Streptomonospora nanhaiensis TaxID=1323731 RepID=A0A853BNZ5_9ACTN|nr:8-oxo-dGTP pyrophosphatase MutT (NUDIX family) [Streptomonospora nanhaiensis]